MKLAEALWELTAQARWFGGRGRNGKLARVRSLDPVGDVQSLLLEVAYPTSEAETYHVPVLHSKLPSLAEAVDDGLSLWPPFGASDGGFTLIDDLPRPGAARRFKGEQSNTNVFFDNSTMLKVLRRVEPGGGIEAELLGALRGSGVAPELHGTWAHDDLALGVLVEALEDPEDAYDVAGDAARSGREFSSEAHSLGKDLATVHSLLRTHLATGVADSLAKADAFRERFDAAVRELPALEEFRDGVRRVYDRVGAAHIDTQRVHGDCHLGQVLRSLGQWKYVDFEGEPMKSLEERRELDTPLRDVAGMLRSFAYAREAGDASSQWLDACREAFLDGYGVRTDPVLDAYELDKAVYEALYEARFRPHLADVPIAAIRTLTSA
uniref:phosphotransferase n=1 Tax=Tessaracoccus timonensis TaxID=2161816 RepID=UPI00131F1399|nr:phosphotransferase [Tessaracoccus timonensis]